MTTSRVRAVHHYIKLLFETTKEQALSLLYYATPKQVEAIAEIAYNLITITVPGGIKRLVNRNKRLLERLCKKSSNLSAKAKLIKSQARKIITILYKLKQALLELVS